MNSPVLPSHLANLISSLWECGAIAIDLETGFQLAFHEHYPDAPCAPLYMDLRTKNNKDGRLRQDEVGRVGLALDILAREKQVDGNWICGIPNAGVPFGKALSQIRTIQHLDLVKRMVEGHHQFDFVNGSRPDATSKVLLVDDLISDATVKRLALNLVKQTGADVTLLVLMDRQQGGLEALRAEGYKAYAAFTLSEFLAESLRIRRLTPDQHAAAAGYPAVLSAYKAEHGIL